MTFQPPPPPPGGNPPPPPPPGQWGPPPGGGYGAPQGGFDPKNVNPLDWGIIGAGVLAFIFSFINFYTYSAKGGFSGVSVDQSAWSGFLSLLAILLIIVGLMSGMFLSSLDQTVVGTSIRTIADDLDGLSLQAWVTTAYLITSTISTPKRSSASRRTAIDNGAPPEPNDTNDDRS